MKRTTAVLASAALLSVAFVGYDAASYAATGQSVILGKTNKSGKTTIVKMSKAGAALDLRTNAASPPLKVSSGKKVANLNADRLDGFDAAALQTHARHFTLTPRASATSSLTTPLTGIAPGQYLVSYYTIVSGSGATICHLTGLSTKLVSYGSDSGFGFVSNAASAVVTVSGPTPNVTMRCFAATGTVNYVGGGSDVSSVDFIPLDVVAATSGTTLRSAPPSARTLAGR